MRPAINGELSCVKFRQNRNGVQFVKRFLVGRVRDSLCKLPRKRWKGAFVSESALHSFDGDKPNSVGVIAHADDHSSHPSRTRDECPVPQSRDRNATLPEDFIGPAALPLFCLAPHGVFRASRIAPRAVSSYLAFSPLPALFSKNRRYVFCDTFRQRSSRGCGTNVARVFYAACCRMVFGLSSSKSRQTRDPPAIICHRKEVYHNQESRKAGRESPTQQLP